MTTPAYPLPPARRLSKSSLISFICGFLTCIPGVGLLAMLLGVIGFFRAGKPGVYGRWMAVIGTIFGTVGTALWALIFCGAIGVAGLIGSAWATPGIATHDFIKALADNDPAAIKDTSMMSDDDLLKNGEYVRTQGGFIDTTFSFKDININEGGTAHVDGTVQFKSGKQRVRADLTSGGTKGWRVTSIDFGG